MNRHKFFYLFLSLVALLLFHPLSAGGSPYTLFLNVLFSAVFLAAVYAVSRHELRFHIGLALGVLWLSLRWFNYLAPAETYAAAAVFEILFLLFIGGAVLFRISKATHIAADIIFGAISVYLILGIIWADLFFLVESFSPGSFTLYSDGARMVADGLPWPDFLFFSFTTLTTLGYGDITPINPFARSLSALEAIVGLLYITILIARLASMYGERRGREKG